MTNAERTLFLAFIDNSISQLQALRGAFSVLGGPQPTPPRPKEQLVADDEFAVRYNQLLGGIQAGNDDGEVNAK